MCECVTQAPTVNLKNRIPPEITRSQLQCQEEHMSSSVTELFVPFVEMVGDK